MASNEYLVRFYNRETDYLHSEYNVFAPDEEKALSTANRKFANEWSYESTDNYRANVTFVADATPVTEPVLEAVDPTPIDPAVTPEPPVDPIVVTPETPVDPIVVKDSANE